MLSYTQDYINRIFDTYKHLPENYFSRVLWHIFLIAGISLVISILYVSGIWYLANYFSFEYVQLFRADFLFFTADISEVFLPINLLMIALFSNHFAQRFSTDNQGDSLADNIRKIHPSKWWFFAALLGVVFMLDTFLYSQYYYSFGNNFYSDEDASAQLMHWAYYIIDLGIFVIFIVGSVILAFFNQINRKTIFKNRIIISSVSILLCVIFALTHLINDWIDFYIGQLIVIPLKNSQMAVYIIFTLQALLYLLVFPLKVTLLTPKGVIQPELKSDETILE